jgi:hypothetical protein
MLIRIVNEIDTEAGKIKSWIQRKERKSGLRGKDSHWQPIAFPEYLESNLTFNDVLKIIGEQTQAIAERAEGSQEQKIVGKLLETEIRDIVQTHSTHKNL